MKWSVKDVADVKKIMQGLRCHSSRDNNPDHFCYACPYYWDEEKTTKDNFMEYLKYSCIRCLTADALGYLEEMEGEKHG